MYSYYRDGHPANTDSGMDQTQTQYPGWVAPHPLGWTALCRSLCDCTACQGWRRWKGSWRCFVVLWEPSGWMWPGTGQLPFKYTHLSWVTMKCYTWWQLVLAVPSRCAFTFLSNKGQCIFIKWPSPAQREKQQGGYRGSEAATELPHHQKVTGQG